MKPRAMVCQLLRVLRTSPEISATERAEVLELEELLSRPASALHCATPVAPAAEPPAPAATNPQGGAR